MKYLIYFFIMASLLNDQYHYKGRIQLNERGTPYYQLIAIDQNHDTTVLHEFPVLNSITVDLSYYVSDSIEIIAYYNLDLQSRYELNIIYSNIASGKISKRKHFTLKEVDYAFVGLKGLRIVDEFIRINKSGTSEYDKIPIRELREETIIERLKSYR